MKRKTFFGALAGTCAVVTMSSVASAAIVLPNQSPVSVPEPAPGGALVDTQTQPFATATYTGDLISRVFSGDPTNPFGGYTFTYQLTNAPGGSNALTRLTVTGFGGYATDMSYQLGTGNVAPSRSTRDPFGDVIGFSFLGDGVGFIMPGESSELLVVQTNATSYRTRIANVINGAVSNVNAFSPAGAITPEPTLALGAVAAGIVFGRRRRA